MLEYREANPRYWVTTDRSATASDRTLKASRTRCGVKDGEDPPLGIPYLDLVALFLVAGIRCSLRLQHNWESTAGRRKSRYLL